MIIRNNLATNPVVNFSLYFIACLLLTATAIAFTIFNVGNIVNWYSQSGRLNSRIVDQQKRIAELQSQAREVQGRIDQIKTKKFTHETQFFNDAIQRRIFSWTRLFDQLEKAFPENVRMISIYPTIKENRVNINMEIAGKSLRDNFQLVQILQNSPIFSDVIFKGERRDETGIIYSQISLEYLPDKTSASEIQTTGETQ
jgi:Tfp pilus assembly protein PilN